MLKGSRQHHPKVLVHTKKRQKHDGFESCERKTQELKKGDEEEQPFRMHGQQLLPLFRLFIFC